MNLFEMSKERQERETAASYDGFVKGRSVGIDTGRTEAFNDVSDAIDSRTARTRLNKERLKKHVMKKR
jgi:hypothetical protein